MAEVLNILPLQIFRSRKRVNEHNSLKCTTYQNMYNFLRLFHPIQVKCCFDAAVTGNILDCVSPPPPPISNNFVYKNIDFNWSLIEFVFHLMCRGVHTKLPVMSRKHIYSKIAEQLFWQK